jgi:YfiH family protein
MSRASSCTTPAGLGPRGAEPVDVVRHPSGVVTWAFPFAGPDLLAAVTTRHGGSSEAAYASCNLGGHVGDDPARVRANRDAVAAALGVDALTIADQQHGRRVAVVDAGSAGSGHDPTTPPDPELAATDALVTLEPEVALAVLVADCAPVVLVDPGRRALAVAHAGRRGAVVDVLAATIDVLRTEAGSDPSALVAGVGPCIGRDAYEIDGTALAEVESAFGGAFLVPSGGGRACFDLRAAVVHRLEQAGVRPDRIHVAGTTTDRAPADLFSDRAARPCGRFALVAALRSGPVGRR